MRRSLKAISMSDYLEASRICQKAFGLTFGEVALLVKKERIRSKDQNPSQLRTTNEARTINMSS